MDIVSTPSHPDIPGRKKEHLAVCLDQSLRIEGDSPGFGELSFIHRPLPEISADEISTKTDFLGTSCSLPLLISCMTGGSSQGKEVNQLLALAAQEAGIPVGLGSIRVLDSHPELFDQFHLKTIARDVPVIANIGGQQVRDGNNSELIELIKKLEVQALAVHLNPGQEFFQPGGDRDFRGIGEAIARLCEISPVPVIVKETGFGIPPVDVRALLDMGAAYVDLAGAGGTNWVLVESCRFTGAAAAAGKEFAGWGLKTAVLLDAMRGRGFPLIASGGVRGGLDLAKSLALGAVMGGMALPFIRGVLSGGVDEVLQKIEEIKLALQGVMLLTASKDIPSLRNVPLMRTPSFRDAVEFLRKGEWEL